MIIWHQRIDFAIDQSVSNSDSNIKWILKWFMYSTSIHVNQQLYVIDCDAHSILKMDPLMPIGYLI